MSTEEKIAEIGKISNEIETYKTDIARLMGAASCNTIRFESSGTAVDSFQISSSVGILVRESVRQCLIQERDRLLLKAKELMRS